MVTMSTLTVTPTTPDNAVLAFVREHTASGAHVQIVATEPYMTPAEAAEALNASRTFVMSKIRDGSIRSTRRGNRHRIPVAEVERFRAESIRQIAGDAAADVEAELFGEP